MIPSLNHPVTFRVPAAIDLDDIFDELDRDYAAYLLDTLHRKTITWQFDDDGYTRLRREYLTKFIPKRRLTGIRATLEQHGVIKIDRLYRVGNHSIGYRLEPDHWRSKEVECGNKQLANKIRTWQRERDKLQPVHRWLRSHLSRLQFDFGLAERIISTMRPDAGSRMTDSEYQVLIHEICKRFKPGGSRNFSVDAYGRVHTSVTNLPKELRCCLTMDGQHLAGLDLANSQPLICGIVAQRFATSPNARRRMQERRYDHRTTPYVRQELVAMRKHPAVSQAQDGNRGLGSEANQPGELSPIMWRIQPSSAVNTGVFSRRQLPSGAPVDLIRYLAVCEEGQLYEHLMEPGDDRDELKVQVFRDVFFGRAGSWSPLMRRFDHEFPTVAEMLRSLKRRDYKHSSRSMQSYESTLFIAIICERMRKERPDVPIFTIHDCILTVADHAEYVREVILDEFAKLGIHPKLTEEGYS